LRAISVPEVLCMRFSQTSALVLASLCSPRRTTVELAEPEIGLRWQWHCGWCSLPPAPAWR
jgi:hypothetical protein